MFRYDCWCKCDNGEGVSYYTLNGSVMLDVADDTKAKEILDDECGYDESEGDLLTNSKVEV